MPEFVPAPVSVRGPLVLLMEPEPMLRLTMTKFLQRSGYRVSACPDVTVAETLLAGGTVRPALIVLGVRALDRGAAADAHRLREAAPDTPMLGVADTIDDAGDAFSLPHNLRFLAHPFDMPDVLRAIRSSLRKSGASPRQSGAEAAVNS
jgi:DNA-binding response OmpR family regulator